MYFLYTLTELKTRAHEIKIQSGLLGLLSACLRFIISPIYSSESFYLYEHKVEPEDSLPQSYLRIDISSLNFRAITSNQEAEKMETEGFYFRSYPTYFNHKLKLYTKWLESGAIACCTFVEKEFAAIHWVILSKNTRDKITFPITVDFINHEAITRGAWVNPKYRELGLFRYNVYNRDRFMFGKGITITRSPIAFNNQVGLALSKITGSRKYGTARMQKILWWKSWKETHFT
jgi:hypothetical protein